MGKILRCAEGKASHLQFHPVASSAAVFLLSCVKGLSMMPVIIHLIVCRIQEFSSLEITMQNYNLSIAVYESF